MKKLIIFSLILVAVNTAISQETYMTDSTRVRFFSATPIENIEAINTKSKSLIKTGDNSIAAVIPIISFHFEKSMMEEHFNENYMETSKYSHAQFKGKFKEDIDLSKNGTTEVTAEGKMTIHGVENDATLTGTLEVKDHPVNKGEKQIIANTVFKIKLADYDIKIPKAVIKNIAEEVEVTSYFEYSLKKK